jgi:hypothetical protein
MARAKVLGLSNPSLRLKWLEEAAELNDVQQEEIISRDKGASNAPLAYFPRRPAAGLALTRRYGRASNDLKSRSDGGAQEWRLRKGR